MTDTPPPRFRIADAGAILAITLSLAGLVWNASWQAGRIDDHSRRIAVNEVIIAADHDSIVDMKADLRYLVERARERETSRK